MDVAWRVGPTLPCFMGPSFGENRALRHGKATALILIESLTKNPRVLFQAPNPKTPNPKP